MPRGPTIVTMLAMAAASSGWQMPGDVQAPHALSAGLRDARITAHHWSWDIAVGDDGALWVATVEWAEPVPFRVFHSEQDPPPTDLVLRTREAGRWTVVHRQRLDEGMVPVSVTTDATGAPLVAVRFDDRVDVLRWADRALQPFMSIDPPGHFFGISGDQPGLHLFAYGKGEAVIAASEASDWKWEPIGHGRPSLSTSIDGRRALTFGDYVTVGFRSRREVEGSWPDIGRPPPGGDARVRVTKRGFEWVAFSGRDGVGVFVEGSGQLQANGLPIRASVHEGDELTRLVFSGWCRDGDSPDPGPTTRLRTGPCADGVTDGPAPLDLPQIRASSVRVLDGVVPKVFMSHHTGLYAFAWRGGQWWGLDSRPRPDVGLAQSTRVGETPVFVDSEPLTVRWVGFDLDTGALLEQAQLQDARWTPMKWDRVAPPSGPCTWGGQSRYTHWESTAPPRHVFSVGPLCEGKFYWLMPVNTTETFGLDSGKLVPLQSNRQAATDSETLRNERGSSHVFEVPGGTVSGRQPSDPVIVGYEDAMWAAWAQWSEAEQIVVRLASRVGGSWSVEDIVIEAEEPRRVATSEYAGRVIAAWTGDEGVYARVFTDGTWKPLGGSDLIWRGTALPHQDVLAREHDVCVTFAAQDVRGSRIAVLCHPW